MFKKIYLFELNSWFNKPAFYLYALLSAGLTALFMGSTAGAFDSGTATVTSLKYVNSPNGLLMAVLGIGVYIFLLFPNIMGASIHKDYKYNVHKVMYSFPFSKSAYFWGKFLSAMTICSILMVFVGVGAYAGTLLPGVNEELIGPQRIAPYLQVYAIYIIPGLLLFGAIIFAVVTYSRSVVAAFVVMIAIYVLQGVADSAMESNEWDKLAALLDPFGIRANLYYTKYWTIAEENNSPLPFTGLVIWNRLLWTAVGVSLLLWSYLAFDFKVEPKGWKLFNRKQKELRTATHQIVKTQKVRVPKVDRSYGILQNLRAAWQLTKIDLKYILTGGPFIVITILGALFILLMFLVSGLLFETPTLPTTKEMLGRAGGVFNIFLLLLTIVYSGLIINRKTTDNIYQLEDVTPTPDWSFILSKFMSITLMQAVLFVVPMLCGIAYQLYNGYYALEVDLYLKDFYGVRWLQMIPMALMALFIFTLIPNYYVGLVVTLVVVIGFGFVDRLGVEQDIYKYNRGQGVGYSDMAGYGWYLGAFYIYRLYWLLCGLFLVVLSWFMWRRGSAIPFFQRLKNTAKKWSLRSALWLVGSFVAFLGVGYFIYYHTNVLEKFQGSKDQEIVQADYEKEYKKYELSPQPRIVDINLDVELFPKEGNLNAKGYYWLENKTEFAVDSIFITWTEIFPEISFDISSDLILNDTVANFMIFTIDEKLMPGDSLKMNFVVQNKENTIFSRHAPIRYNGTFFNNYVFPAIGYQPFVELSENKARKKYDLPDKERMALATDSIARQNTYLSNSADWVNFEIKIGTVPDQIAIAPGNLVREWEDGDRKYFHYKMKRPMLNFYNICSAEYEVLQDKWNDIDLAIYYHKGHDFNLDRIIAGLKDGFDYYTEYYSPYQHDQVRILEVPRVGFAQSFANTIPFSENVGFVAMPDDSEDGGVDYTYAITAHELAHQWWAHQVIGANVQGSTMLSESLSEYSSLKVLERRYGKSKMRKFLKDALDKYLQFRSLEKRKELPLAYNENQPYIHYQKGSLAFYALSDYIGEERLNAVLSAYIDSVAYQEAPYTTALELIAMLREATPDSLQYFIDDMFEHITLYDNRIESTSYAKNADGTYTVDITAHVTKYRTDERGRQLFEDENGNSLSLEIDGKSKPMKSYPLNDYVDVGVFASKEVDGKTEEVELYLKKHRIDQIENKFTIIVNELPKEVGIDPYNKLIDRNSADNRRKVEEKKE